MKLNHLFRYAAITLITGFCAAMPGATDPHPAYSPQLAQAGGAPLGLSEKKTSKEIFAPPEGMAFIAGGYYRVGREQIDYKDEKSDETPQHEIILNPFYIDLHEVTNAEYRKCVEANKCPEPVRLEFFSDRRYDDFPVVNVTWFHAKKYAEYADKRLPTEAEWEVAASGGMILTAYPWGNEFDPNRSNVGTALLAKVGSYPKNSFGLYDMIGNAAEWCADWYAAQYYKKSPLKNPPGPKSGSERVIRGSSWLAKPDDAKTAVRHHASPETADSSIGFRLARDVKGFASK